MDLSTAAVWSKCSKYALDLSGTSVEEQLLTYYYADLRLLAAHKLLDNFS